MGGLNLNCVQSDKKIKTLTDTAELIEDAVHSATVNIIVIIMIIISYNLCSVQTFESKLQFSLPFLNNLFIIQNETKGCLTG